MVKAVKDASKGNMKWEERHTHVLIHGLIEHLLLSRPAFYHIPGLHGEVDGHGGNRISQKIIETCKKMARDAGLDVAVVQEIINRGKAKGTKRERAEDGGLPKGTRRKRVKQEM